MAQVGAPPPPPLAPQAGMGPPARPHHAADASRHRQHQQQQHHHHHHHHKSRPPGSSGAAAAGSNHARSHHKPAAPAAGRPAGQAAATAAQPGQAVPAIAADGTAELERLRRDTPFMCNIRFKNDLPEIPGDPKLLVSRFEPDKLSHFFLTSIEQQPRRELLLPADVGVTISLMDLERFDAPVRQPGERHKLDPADEALLQDVDNLPSAGQNVSPLKVKRATKGVGPTWLMATTYLTSSNAGSRRGAAAGPAAGPAGSSRFEMAQQQPELTREQQLADIEATFTAAMQPPRHPTKPGVTAVSCVPLFPDFSMWADKFVTVNFEKGDPAQDSKTLAQVKDPELRSQLISRCMIKSYQPQSGSEPAMGLLVPRSTAAAAAQGQPIADGCEPSDLEGDYNWDCEYGFDLVTREQAKAADTLLLIEYDDRMGYCQFDGDLKLRKRKRQEGDEPRPEKACIFHRDFKPQEEQERELRNAEIDDRYEQEEADEAAEQEDEY